MKLIQVAITTVLWVGVMSYERVQGIQCQHDSECGTPVSDFYCITEYRLDIETGHTTQIWGQCERRREDGDSCNGLGDNGCLSGSCICSACGKQVPSGYRCYHHSNCYSGFCSGFDISNFPYMCAGRCDGRRNNINVV